MKKTVSLDSAMLKAARRQKAFGDGVHMIHVAD